MEDLRSKQKTFTQNVAHLIAFAFRNGFELTFGEVYRTPEQQQLYFNKGLSKTLNSRHLQRLAVDFNIFKNGQLLSKPIDIKPLGDYWITLHPDNRWGGDWNRDGDLSDEKFKDPYHFEVKEESVPEPVKMEATEKRHYVNPGDTLYSIAKANNTTVDALKLLNGMSNHNIIVGQTLKVS